MIQIFLIQIIRGVRERPAFPILPYMTQMRYYISNLLNVEHGVSSISTNIFHLTYRNINILLTGINKSFQLYTCIVSFLVLLKLMVRPRLYCKFIVKFILAVQKCKWPIISCIFCTWFLNNLLVLGEAKAADAERFVVCAKTS